MRTAVAVATLMTSLLIHGTGARAAGDCSTAALSYYCTGVTIAMSQATHAPLNAALLTKAAGYGKSAERLGYKELREKYQTAGAEDTANASDSDKMKGLVATCVSGDQTAIAAFMRKTTRDCPSDTESSRQKSGH